MKNLILPTLLFTILILGGGCRTAKWHLDKAFEKGLKVDTITKIIHDSILISQEPFDHTFDAILVERDTVIIKELCKDPVKNVVNRKFPRALCPQLDTAYQITVEVQDTVYLFPIHIRLVDGTYRFHTTNLKIPYITKAETNLSFVPPASGYKLGTLLLWAALAFTVGLALAFFTLGRLGKS